MSEQFNAPRKSLGQNFLQDPNIIRKIVNAVGVRQDDIVLEIGPGRGALTEHLLDVGCRLHLVEFDRDLIQYWQDRALDHPNLSVHGGDILEFDFDELKLTKNQRIKVVGNLPYNISSPILIMLLKHTAIIDRLIIMLQKEVIDRLSAEPGNKQYGRLSVVVQQAFRVDNLFNVPNTAFFPPPKVTSAVAQLLPHNDLPVSNHLLFSELVKQAFGQRRKTLRNNFKNSDHWNALQQQNIDFSLRAETIDVADYVRWCNAIDKA